MRKSVHARANVWFLIAILSASSVTMLWLFWRFPVVTGIATAGFMIALLVSARLARSTDGDDSADLDRPDHRGMHSP